MEKFSHGNFFNIVSAIVTMRVEENHLEPFVALVVQYSLSQWFILWG